MTCTIAGCVNEAKAAGLCWAHAKRKQKGLPMDTPLRGHGPRDTTCTVEGCTKPVKATGLCNSHYHAFREGRELEAPVKRELALPASVAIARSVPEDLAEGPQKLTVKRSTPKQESSTMSKFSIDQGVKFKSGGPEMTVISVSEDEETVVAGWFNNTASKAEDPPTWSLEQQEFPAETIQPSDEDEDE